MKKILCYGDSNTFGFNPENGKRLDENSRWSGILKSELKNFEIIEQGLNNRTAVVENFNAIEYDASRHLPKILDVLKLEARQRKGLRTLLKMVIKFLFLEWRWVLI